MLTRSTRYLHSFPFQDNPTLHIYTGMLSMYMSQHRNYDGDMDSSDLNLLREARSQFERTLEVDPGNDVAIKYRDMVDKLQAGDVAESEIGNDWDDDELYR